jgi:hypothetical protein
MPVKRVLDSRDPRLMGPMLQILQLMLRCNPHVGAALTPFYRQLLPVFNRFMDTDPQQSSRPSAPCFCSSFGGKRGSWLCWRVENEDRLDSTHFNIPLLMRETLELIEANGAPGSYFMIKYIIPTYESCFDHPEPWPAASSS